ncbi:MAG: hypothetical protein U0165_03910 [Polyangiaceae bacterium]
MDDSYFSDPALNRRSRWVRACVAYVSTVCVIGSITTAARADDESTINLGVNSYDSGRYSECVDRFREMLTPGSSMFLQEVANKPRARMYYVACLIAVGNTADADTQLRTLILDNPRFRPDAAIFPTRVLDRFTEMQGKLKPEIEALEKRRLEAEELERQQRDRDRKAAAERLERLRMLAMREEIVHRNSRWIATIPFGVGQFQNEQPVLGWVFLSTEVAAGVTSIVSGIIQQSIVARYEPGVTDYNCAQTNADRAALVNRISFATLVGLGVVGVAHAQLTFVPQTREVRYRPLPPELSWSIGPMGLPGGGGMALGGSF